VCCLGGLHARAEAIVVQGQVGVIGEWALKASLAPPHPEGSGDAQIYSGLLKLRHVGVCSVEGPEEKTGRATASMRAGVVDQLVLAFGADNCVYPGPLHLSSKVSRGFMRCKSGFQVPISLWTVP
jgi:hypothetical protein